MHLTRRGWTTVRENRSDPNRSVIKRRERVPWIVVHQPALVAVEPSFHAIQVSQTLCAAGHRAGAEQAVGCVVTLCVAVRVPRIVHDLPSPMGWGCSTILSADLLYLQKSIYHIYPQR
eukprot:SAG31_NODE_957_length_10768_cov_3.322992_1_plen_117_part_10